MKKKEIKKSRNINSCNVNCANCGSAVYGLGFIGALVYYISNANGFWMIILGILKAIVWPGFLVYELMKFLGM